MEMLKTSNSNHYNGFGYLCAISYIFYKPCKQLYMSLNIYAHMTTNIRISKNNRDKLSELKQKGEYKNLDEVITHLLSINERYAESTVVRLVKE